jgi:hypothetical protein
MLARLRRHLFHTVETAYESEPAVASFRELARVEACQRLARASAFRLLGKQRVTLAVAEEDQAKFSWIREQWVLEEVTLTITDDFYCFTTRWPDHEVCTFSNPHQLCRPHLGLDVLPGSGAGFATDLAEHRAKVKQVSETRGAPTRVETLEDEDAGERRYYLEQVPLGRLLAMPAGVAWWSQLWQPLISALGMALIALAGLHWSGVDASAGGLVYAALVLGIIVVFLISEIPSLFFHGRHFYDRSAEVREAGLQNAKELSIATFKDAVTGWPARGGPALRCPLCRDDLLGLQTVSCLGCRTLYHHVCAAEFPRCSTLGCGRAFLAYR